jgi:hypothetical protein
MIRLLWQIIVILNFFYSVMHTQDSEATKPCELKYSDSKSAYERATTLNCKQKILEASCKLQNDELFNKISEDRMCPERVVKFIGCIKNKLVKKFNKKLKNENYRYFIKSNITSQTECINHCFAYSHKFAIFNRTRQSCKCISFMGLIEMKDYFGDHCDNDKNSKHVLMLYDTGFKSNIFLCIRN